MEPVKPGDKILVTGGGGFLGREIVRQLLAEGFLVRSFSRGTYPDLERMGAECSRGDVTSFSDVNAAVQGVSAIIHTAAKVGIGGSHRDFWDINVRGTQNLLQAASENGVHKFVHCSSASVVFGREDICHGDESLPYPTRFESSYGETKALAEKAVIAASIPAKLHTLILRPHLVWGEGDPHFIPKLRKRKFMQIGPGTNLVDVLHVENGARGHLDALKNIHRPEISSFCFFLGQNEPVNMWDFIRAMMATQGLEMKKGHIPASLALVGATLLEKLLPKRDDPVITRFSVLQLTHSHYFSHKRAKDLLGYEPTVTTAEGLERLRRSSSKAEQTFKEARQA